MIQAQKIGGVVLIAVGLAVIVYVIVASASIFQGNAEAPQLFSSGQKSNAPSQDSTGQIEQLIQNQLGAFIPEGSLSGMMNLIAWSIFVTILVFAGGQIAGLGVKMLKA